MYRVRFHGRGGQGMKTAGRILGNALFAAGFEVQDAPRYGAERRGAPIFAYVRADRAPIHERGVITRPDLVVVADDTLVGVPNAGVTQGLGPATTLLILGSESETVWRERLRHDGPLLTLAPGANDDDAFFGPVCAGAAARLLGGLGRDALALAVREELEDFAPGPREAAVVHALAGYDAMAAFEGSVGQSGALEVASFDPPDWIELPLDAASIAAPAIHAGATSVEVRTGLWRTLRPVIDYERCNRCSWVCSTFCPDNAIVVGADGYPEVDLDHCKGCMICVAQCPPHAIEAVPEKAAAAEAEGPER
ncbi:MAG: 2-oxoacid:acceptor oxidoreductase family protein [Gammaproteobacteria bacterium]